MCPWRGSQPLVAPSNRWWDARSVGLLNPPAGGRIVSSSRVRTGPTPAPDFLRRDSRARSRQKGSVVGVRVDRCLSDGRFDTTGAVEENDRRVLAETPRIE